MMSASLREKLRKSSRYSMSPVTPKSEFKSGVTKTEKIEDINIESRSRCVEESKISGGDELQLKTKDNTVPSESLSTHDKVPSTSSINKRTPSWKVLKEKENLLHKLRLVKKYRTKNDATKIESLILKWREVVQQALQDLHSKLPEPKPSLTQLIDHLHIEHTVIKYNNTTEDFEV